MTWLASLFAIVVAVAAGVLVGRRRALVAGIALGIGVLAAGALGYVALLAFALPM